MWGHTNSGIHINIATYFISFGGLTRDICIIGAWCARGKRPEGESLKTKTRQKMKNRSIGVTLALPYIYINTHLHRHTHMSPSLSL